MMITEFWRPIPEPVLRKDTRAHPSYRCGTCVFRVSRRLVSHRNSQNRKENLIGTRACVCVHVHSRAGLSVKTQSHDSTRLGGLGPSWKHWSWSVGGCGPAVGGLSSSSGAGAGVCGSTSATHHEIRHTRDRTHTRMWVKLMVLCPKTN